MSDRIKFIEDKILNVEQAKLRVATWRLKGDRIVFTNGCFDILHKGHVSYLGVAASLGNRLVVGLNSDSSVKNQGKGDGRPVNDELSRAIVLASLGVVDMVILFEENTPIKLVEALTPDVLAKGADYDPFEQNPERSTYIVGSDIVRKSGGEVVAIPLVEGFSTTALIEKLKG